MLSNHFGDELLPIILPIVQQRLQDADWRTRESGSSGGRGAALGAGGCQAEAVERIEYGWFVRQTPHTVETHTPLALAWVTAPSGPLPPPAPPPHPHPTHTPSGAACSHPGAGGHLQRLRHRAGPLHARHGGHAAAHPEGRAAHGAVHQVRARCAACLATSMPCFACAWSRRPLALPLHVARACGHEERPSSRCRAMWGCAWADSEQPTRPGSRPTPLRPAAAGCWAATPSGCWSGPTAGSAARWTLWCRACASGCWTTTDGCRWAAPAHTALRSSRPAGRASLRVHSRHGRGSHCHSTPA